MSNYWRPQTIINHDIIRENNASATTSSSIVMNRHKHLSISQQRQLLPIFQCKNQILYALEKFRTVVLVGGNSVLYKYII